MSTAALAGMSGFFRVKEEGNDTLGRVRSLQAERRVSDLWLDTHGREWYAERDLKTGHPCTPLTPNNWRAPILPPPEFREFAPGRGRARFDILYAKWEEHQGALQAHWDKEVRKLAVQMFPNTWATEIREHNPMLFQEAGPPPYSVEFIRAASRGNRWVLGLSALRPAWVTDALYATIPVPVRTPPMVAQLDAYPDAPGDEDAAERITANLRYADLDEERDPAPRRVHRKKPSEDE